MARVNNFVVLVTKKWLFLLPCLAILLLTSFAVVYINHKCRLNYTKLHQLSKQQEQASQMYSQLLLEYGMLTSDLRVERLAKQMGFVFADNIEVFS